MHANSVNLFYADIFGLSSEASNPLMSCSYSVSSPGRVFSWYWVTPCCWNSAWIQRSRIIESSKLLWLNHVKPSNGRDPPSVYHLHLANVTSHLSDSPRGQCLWPTSDGYPSKFEAPWQTWQTWDENQQKVWSPGKSDRDVRCEVQLNVL